MSTAAGDGAARDDPSEVILVVGDRDASAVPPPYSTTRVAPDDPAVLDATAAAETLRAVPAAHVVTNSRGESLVSLRSSGERQTAVFLDGALLNVPWDNRVDLGAIPAQLIRGMSVVRGAVPVEYGANVLGGAVNLSSATSRSPSGTRAEAVGGSGGHLQASLVHSGGSVSWRYAGAAGYTTLDGLSLSHEASLPFGQSGSGMRTNTDARSAFAAGQGSMAFSSGPEVHLTVVHVDGHEGVAPEGHLDPAVSRARYWRYPDQENTLAILSSQGTLGAGGAWRGAAWVNRVEQTLDAFTSESYDTLDTQEFARDFTLGARAVAEHEVWKGDLKIALNALTSSHTTRERQYDAGGQTETPSATYRQATVSAGTEYRFTPFERFALVMGTSYDAMFALDTGDKPSIDPFHDYAFTLGAGYATAGGWRLHFGLGRRTRFPTMRELCSEALNRFLLNPDLKPESAILLEAGVALERSAVRAEVVPFASFTQDTIDQRFVTTPGETAARRERVNLKGSQTIGVEYSLALRVRPDLDVQAHLTLTRTRREQESPSEPVQMQERPDAVGRIFASYRPSAGFGALAEGVYTGRAYSLDVNNALKPLPRSFVVDVRTSYRWAGAGTRGVELFARINNVLDELALPQLGLPEAGRTILAGIVVDF